MEQARVAVIDLGTNAVRLQVAKLSPLGHLQVIHDERAPIRPGEEVFKTHRLSREAMERTLEVLHRYAGLARSVFKVERIRAVGTCALREATNSAELLAEARSRCALEVEVISGSEEARLIARGVLWGVRERGRYALVDLGGGSTELTAMDGECQRGSHSLELGSVRLTDAFFPAEPEAPLPSEAQRTLREYVRTTLRRELAKCTDCPTIVGTAGTIVAVGTFILRRKGRVRPIGPSGELFSAQQFREAAAALAAMSYSDRQSIAMLEPQRARIIVAGALLFDELCAHLGTHSVRVARRGLRDGVMLDELERAGARLPRRAQAGRGGRL